MQFEVLRATKWAVSAAAFAVALAGGPLIQVTYAQAAGAQQPAQGGQQQGKNWKDRAEYDLYNSIAHEQDPQKKLDLLDQWTQKYPTTDFEDLRTQSYLTTYGPLSQKDPAVRPKAVSYFKQVLQKDPKNTTALYFLALTVPQMGGNNPEPNLIADAETAGKGLLEAQKPANTSDADWEKAKKDIDGLAHSALGWAASAKKDYPTAQKEYEEYLKVNPNNASVSYQLGQTLILAKQYAPALWSFARAASYDGPGALPPNARPQVLAYFKKVYNQYHGSEEGADQLLAQAKSSPLPPDGFKIEGAQEKEAQRAAELEAKIKADPSLGLWYSVQQSLTGDGGDAFFTSNVKDTEIPGGANNIKYFTGTVISAEPTKIVLGVLDPAKPDATLVLADPLPPDAVKVGDKLQFAGVGESFTKEPYMLTFKEPELPSVKQAKTPAKKGTRKQMKK